MSEQTVSTLGRGERDLLLFFMGQLSDHMSSAGCNDMEQTVIDAIDPVDRLNLYRDFLEYDKKANPDGWEPRPITHVPDFLWVGYLESKIRGLK